MKTFKTFLNEETTPTSGVSKGVIDINNHEVRATINAALAAAFGQAGIFSPLQAINVASKVLANYHIFLPQSNPAASNRGVLVFKADQFGYKVGMNDDGRVVEVPPAPYSIVLKYNVVFGRFWATCELISNDSLNEETALNEISAKKAQDYLDASAKNPVPLTADTRKKWRNRWDGQTRATDKILKTQPDHEQEWHHAKNAYFIAQNRYSGRMNNHPDLVRAQKDYDAAAKKYAAAKQNMNEKALDEVSKKTLGSYADKAQDDYFDTRTKFTDKLRNKGSTNHDENSKLLLRLKNRGAGMKRANDKLKNEETINESVSKVKNNVINADQVSKTKDGHIIVKRGYYYTNGVTPEKFADSVSKDLESSGIKHTVVDKGGVRKPFKGGASVGKQSHWWVKLKIHENVEPINELSKDLLQRYLPKAEKSIDTLRNKASTRRVKHNDVVGGSKLDKKAHRRLWSTIKAEKKIAEPINEIDMKAMEAKVGQSTNVTDLRKPDMVSSTMAQLNKAQPRKSGMNIVYSRNKPEPKNLDIIKKHATDAAKNLITKK